MKRYALLLLALVLVSGGAIGLVALRPVAPASIPPPVSRSAPAEPVAMKPIVAPPPVAPRTAQEPADLPPETATLPPLPADAEEAKARILLLANTSDGAHVAELVRYLALLR